MTATDEQTLSSIDMWPLLDKFEDGLERVGKEPALREAILAIHYGADVFHVLDKSLKRYAKLREELEKIKVAQRTEEPEMEITNA